MGKNSTRRRHHGPRPGPQPSPELDASTVPEAVVCDFCHATVMAPDWDSLIGWGWVMFDHDDECVDEFLRTQYLR
jgi:hypothetical protein